MLRFVIHHVGSGGDHSERQGSSEFLFLNATRLSQCLSLPKLNTRTISVSKRTKRLISFELQRTLCASQPRAEELQENDEEKHRAHDATLNAVFSLRSRRGGPVDLDVSGIIPCQHNSLFSTGCEDLEHTPR